MPARQAWCHADRDRDGGAAQGEAVGRPLRDRLADPEGPGDQRAGRSRRTTSARARGPTGSGSRRSTPTTHVERAGRVRPGPAGPPGDRLGRLHRARSSSRSSRGHDADGPVEEVRVFADYLAEGLPAEENARAILEVARIALQRAGSTRSRPTRPAGRGTRSGRRSSASTSGPACGRCGAGRSARWPTAWPWSSRSSARPTAGPG